MLKNLSKIQHANRLAVRCTVDAINTQAKDSKDIKDGYDRAYLYSNALLISAMDGYTASYPQTEAKMQRQLALMIQPDQTTRRIWLMGRLALAQYTYDTDLKDQKKTDGTIEQLRSLLETLLIPTFATTEPATAAARADSKADANTPLLATPSMSIAPVKYDYFTAWGIGYLAAIPKAYVQTKDKMMDAVTQLTADCLAPTKGAKTGSAGKAKPALGNLLWTYTLALQAAANFTHDPENYKMIKALFLSSTGERSIAAAITKHTSRANDDYPAWMLAIVKLAAATMNDRELYNELTPPLAAEIDAAKTAHKVALAQTKYDVVLITAHDTKNINLLAMQKLSQANKGSPVLIKTRDDKQMHIFGRAADGKFGLTQIKDPLPAAFTALKFPDFDNRHIDAINKFDYHADDAQVLKGGADLDPLYVAIKATKGHTHGSQDILGIEAALAIVNDELARQRLALAPAPAPTCCQTSCAVM